MKRNYISLLTLSLLILSHCISNAQNRILIKGRITDYNSDLPLTAVVIKCNNSVAISDTNGNYNILIPTLSQLKFSALGYLDKNVNIDLGKSVYDIQLKRKYFTLSDVEIKANKLNVDSIILKAADNVPLNYLP